MNELDYASFEASKRLVDAGIVLETEQHFDVVDHHVLSEFTIQSQDNTTDASNKPVQFPVMTKIPRPSMAEVWRELQADIYIDKKRYRLSMWKVRDEFVCTYVAQDSKFLREPISDTNPTDALIDLLIWVRNGGV